jgi:hypothetical protein
MSAERLVNILTEIRDQQKRQVENFERALQGHQEYMSVQQKGRQLFAFLVYAPWVALAAVMAYFVFTSQLL